jgi:cell division protein FtsQ
MATAAPSLPNDVRLMNAVASVVFALAAVAVVAALLAWAMRAPLFTLRAIRIEGETGRSSVATVRANALPMLSGNFFTLDLRAARVAFESVPWVRRAVVRRVWPNRLAVTLEEHRAAALWTGEEGNDRLVNVQGEVFEANVGDVEDDGLPRLEGPAGSAAQMLAMHARLSPLFAQVEAGLEGLTLTRRGSWRAALDTGAVVEIGRGTDDELAERTGRFVRTLGQVTARFERPLESADLRHADGYAVRLQGVRTGSDKKGNQR